MRTVGKRAAVNMKRILSRAMEWALSCGKICHMPRAGKRVKRTERGKTGNECNSQKNIQRVLHAGKRTGGGNVKNM